MIALLPFPFHTPLPTGVSMPLFAIAVDGDPVRDIAAAAGHLTDAVSVGMAEAAGDLRASLRDRVASAGLGPKLAAPWRVGGLHAGGTAVSVTVSSTAPLILSAFAEGATILARRGRWLAIPTAAVPRGNRRRFLTPAEVEARRGRPLRFIPAPGGRTAVLVDERAVLFVLVPQVTLARRFDLAGAVAEAGRVLPERIERHLVAET